jgi:hypothetical protein
MAACDDGQGWAARWLHQREQQVLRQQGRVERAHALGLLRTLESALTALAAAQAELHEARTRAQPRVQPG